jgi:hypothetical protein
MNNTLRSTPRPNSHPFPSTTEKANPQSVVRPRKWQTAIRAVRRRLDPITIGFLVGGFALGVGGCILGIFVQYRHPVSLTFSVLWWGFWLGFVGAYVGACAGELFFVHRGYPALEEPSSETPIGGEGI